MNDKSAKNGAEKSTPKSTPKKNGKAAGKDTPTKTPTKGKGGAGAKRKRMLDEEEEIKLVFPSPMPLLTLSSRHVKYMLISAFPLSAELSDSVELPVKNEDLDDAFGDGIEMSQTPKKSRTVLKSSQPAADEAALMYDGSMETI